MGTLSNQRINRQSGFTLIELVVVIVIIGILAAVAVPNLTAATDEARIAKQQAVLGALKSSWAGVYAVTKTGPTCGQIASKMEDPPCLPAATADDGPITCTGVTKADGTGSASFACTKAGIATSPIGITCAATGC